MRYFRETLIASVITLSVAAPVLARQGGQHHGGNGNSSLAACIQFGNGGSDGITSGVENPRYCDGVDGVGIGISLREGARFDTNGRGRTLTFDFGGCGGAGCEGDGSHDVDWRIDLEHGLDDLGGEFTPRDHRLNLTTMGEDAAYTGLRIDFFPAGFRPNELRYRVQFGAGAQLSCDLDPGAQVAFNPVIVERASELQWTIRTGDDATACLFRMTDNARTIEKIGEFSMPFSATLEGF